MSVYPWTAWHLDWSTIGWSAWIVFFAIWETLGLSSNAHVHPLTAHLRPVFVNNPLTWFLALGLWGWLGFHFLVEPFWSIWGTAS